MDLLLDHISLFPDDYPLLNDDMLLAPAFHPGPLTLFPTDTYCLVSGKYLWTCIPRPHLGSFHIGNSHMISCVPPRLRGVHNLVDFADAMQTHINWFPAS